MGGIWEERKGGNRIKGVYTHVSLGAMLGHSFHPQALLSICITKPIPR